MSDYGHCGVCGEPIYDVEEGIRTCGHFDDEPFIEDAEARPDHVGAHRDNPGTEGECPESSSPKNPAARAPQGGTG